VMDDDGWDGCDRYSTVRVPVHRYIGKMAQIQIIDRLAVIRR
jgi:hypothetical protein